MPYPIETKDGIVIDNIPDDIKPTDDRLRALVEELRGSKTKTYSFAAKDRQYAQRKKYTPEEAVQPEQGPQAQITQEQAGAQEQASPSGLGRGAALVGGGALKGFGEAASMIGDPVQRLVNSILGKNDMLPSEALPIFLERIGDPDPQSHSEEILKSIGEGIGGTAAMTAAGGLPMLAGGAGATGTKTLGQAAIKEGVKQAAGGAAYGASKEVAEQAGAAPLVQEAIGMGASVFGSGVAGMRPKALPKAPLQEAENIGVRIATSDIRAPKTFAGKWLQGLGEKIPIFGTGSYRKAQAAERIAAVDDLVRSYGADEMRDFSTDIMKDVLETRSDKIAILGTKKSNIIKKLSAEGSGIVPMTKTIGKIDETVARLKGLNNKEVQGAIDILEDWRKSIQGQNLENIEDLRGIIGAAFKKPELASSRSIVDKSLSGIYDSVRSDMGEYIRRNGGQADFSEWKKANDALSATIDELKIPTLKAVLKKGTSTPEQVNKLLFSSNKSDVKALYRNLSPDGRSSARAAIIAKAYKDSGGEVISPNRFVKNVKDMGEQVGVFFTGDDLAQLEGLQKVMDYTRRAEQAAVSPATGVQNVIPVSAAALASYFGGGMEGFVGAMSAGAGIGGALRVYESKPVRTILAKLPQLAPGSAAEKNAMEQLLIAAQRAGKAITEEEQRTNQWAVSSRSK
jgi:hypothetical protein